MQAFKQKFSKNREQQAPTTTTPYSSEFVAFIYETREQQTLFANSIGNLTAEFNADDRKSLEEFLSSSLFPSQFGQEEKNHKENEKEIQLITNQIFMSFCVSQQRVQVSLIWIFYYSPNENQTNHLPVFQIRNMQGPGMKYMDTSLKFFYSWREVIENVQVGSSFLCIPRDGVYQSKESVLDLEYMWSRPRSNRPFHAVKKYVAFTKSFVENWLMVKVKQLGEICSKAVAAAIAFYKAYHCEINIIVNVIFIIMATEINPSSQLRTLCSFLHPFIRLPGTTSCQEDNSGTINKFTAGLANRQDSAKKFENICNNAVAFSKACMDGYKNRNIDSKCLIESCEKLSLISKDFESLSKDLRLHSLLEKAAKATLNENSKSLEKLIENGNVRSGVLNGTGLSESHILSPHSLNVNWQKYSVCTYHGSDFTEVQKMALCLFKRELRFHQKSNKLFDISGKHVGYIYLLPTAAFCIYLTSEIELNESENLKFVVVND